MKNVITSTSKILYGARSTETPYKTFTSLIDTFETIQPATALAYLKRVGVPATFRKLMSTLITFVKLGTKLKELNDKVLLRENLVPRILSLIPVRDPEAFIVTVLSVQGYMHEIENGGRADKVTITLKIRTATVLRFIKEFIDNIAKATASTPVVSFDDVIKSVDELAKQDKLTHEESEYKWLQVKSKAWQDMLISLKADGLVDTDLPSLLATRNQDITSALTLSARLEIERVYTGRLKKAVEDIILSLPQSSGFIARTNAKSRTAVRDLMKDATGAKLLEAWREYLDHSRLRTLQRDLIETNLQLSKLITANSLLTEIDALRSEDGSVDEFVIKRLVDPIRQTLEWVMRPENSGFEDVKDTVITAVDLAVESLLSHDEIRDRIVSDERGIGTTAIQKAVFAQEGNSAVMVFQRSLVEDPTIFVVFAQHVGLQLALNTDFFPNGWRRALVTDSMMAVLKGAFLKIVTEFDFSWNDTLKRYLFRRLTTSEKESKRADIIHNRRELKRRRMINPRAAYSNGQKRYKPSQVKYY